jgi:hypothetical protein
MMDLEDRLRGTFNDMADELPPSGNPRGDLERRLAGRGQQRWRTPALVAAAAAVVAAVAVPVMVFGGSGTIPVGSGTTQSAEPTSQSQEPDDGRQVLAGGNNDVGTNWTVYAIPGGAEFCTEVDPATAESCSQAQFGVPPEGHVVLTFAMEPADGQTASKLLPFVTAPEVAELLVRDHAGEQVTVAKLASGEGEPSLFVAEFDGPTDGFGYTAKDANGTVLEEALT